MKGKGETNRDERGTHVRENSPMSGIQYVTDENGRKVAVQIDLKTHRQLWKDINDILVSRSRRHEKRVALKASAAKELQELSSKVVARIVPRLENLASAPRPAGCVKLRGGDIQWRIRVGDYRVVYEIDDAEKTVDITRIAHRREVYE